MKHTWLREYAVRVAVLMLAALLAVAAVGILSGCEQKLPIEVEVTETHETQTEKQPVEETTAAPETECTHVFGAWVEDTAPTCTAEGSRTRTCSVCGKTETEPVPAKGHSIVIDPAVEPTCTEPGLTAGKHCSVCGEVIEAQQEIPAKGHTLVDDPAVEPTCTETGLTAGKHCSACGEILEAQQEIPAKGHSIVIELGVAPGCETYGMTEASYCEVCFTVFTTPEILFPTGHTVVYDEKVPPTCTETGLTDGEHCSTCGKILFPQEVIPALGHSFVDGVCERCGALLDDRGPARIVLALPAGDRKKF